jgi:hypothetical protein
MLISVIRNMIMEKINLVKCIKSEQIIALNKYFICLSYLILYITLSSQLLIQLNNAFELKITKL